VEGLPVEEVAITNLGHRMASVVEDVDGDGVFNGSDRVIFFGQRLRGERVHRYRHADENTYLLERLAPDDRPLSPSRPERLEPSHPMEAEAPVGFHRFVHIEEDSHFVEPFVLREHLSTDFTYSTFLRNPDRKERVIEFDADGVDRRSESPFSLSVYLYGESNAGRPGRGIPDHSLVASLNGHELGPIEFNGQVGHRAVFEGIDVGALKRRGNELTLTLVDREEVIVELVHVDWVELLYPTRPFMPDDQGEFALPGPSGGGEFEIGGFTSDRVHLMCLTDNSIVPVETSTDLAGTHSVRFEAPGDDGLYAVATEGRLFSVDSVEAFAPAMPFASEAGYEYLIVTHPDFREAADRLAAHRTEADDLRTLVVNVGDLYDLFNHGVPHPDAIKRGLQHVYESWPEPRLRYALLMGDASWDWHAVEFDNRTFIPTRYRIGTGPEYAGDAWFAMPEGSDMPKFCMGRLPVKTAEEAEGVVSKIIAYGEELRARESEGLAPWRHRILFVASDSPRYRNFLDQAVSEHVEGRFDVRKAYASNVSPMDCTQEMVDSFNEGVAFLSYVGHGARYVWQTGTTLARAAVDYDANFSPERVNDLHNRTMLPIVFGITCFTNNFDNPNPRNCIGERLVLSPEGGALATIASSSYSTIHSDLMMCDALFEALFDENPARVGDLYLAAIGSQKVGTDSRHMFVILGDPAARLPLVPLPGEEQAASEADSEGVASGPGS
jgi:hypothetical protein